MGNVNIQNVKIRNVKFRGQGHTEKSEVNVLKLQVFKVSNLR